MTPGQFLRVVWPDRGHYCIAHRYKLPSGGETYYHKVFDTISAAVTYCLEQKHVQDTFFGVLSLREKQVWNAKKVNPKTGEEGAYEVRSQRNILAAKTLFWDLDVGGDPGKYPTQRDALQDVVRFCEETKLPLPMVLSSGGGLHTYWPFDKTVDVDEWLPLATHLRQLGLALGVKLDKTRTTDSASVLRVLGTHNWKDRTNPREVKMLAPPTILPVETLAQLLSDALIRTGVAPELPKAPRAPVAQDNPFGESNLTGEFQDFGPPPTLDMVAKSCGQIRELIRYHGDDKHPHAGQLDNNGWYKGLVATLVHIKDGPDWVRKLAVMRPRSSADVEMKIAQAQRYAPSRCPTVAEGLPWGDSPCQACPHQHDPGVPNPLAATRKTITAPPPIIQMSVPGVPLLAAMIPDPPKPFKRLATGEVARVSTDKDNNTTTEIIYEHDLYPIKRLSNPETGVEQQLWRTHLPLVGAQDFLIDADCLYDSRKFSATIANNGIFPVKSNITFLQDYMVAYITQLQKAAAADTQASHLGWTNEYREFVLPDKTLREDGTVTPAMLTEAAARAAQHIRRKGDAQAQVRLMSFYNHPAYIPNQFAVLCSLASVIFYATGHHGIVVNMSGDAGASKSTTLYTGASFFGDPEYWPINGTNRGATANGRAQRVAVNANLPTPVDEITHIPQKEMIDLVMNISQPGHRIRLQTDGTERKSMDSYKASIMIATSNSTLHGILSTDSAAGTAGSMRVFEIYLNAQSVHTKAQADEYLRQLNQNFGHIGEAFIRYVITNRKAVEARVQQVMREVDEAAQIKSSERFWSAVIAVVLVAAEITKALGLLPYEAEAIRRWAIDVQVPAMRGVVLEEYRDPVRVVTDYIAEKTGNIVVVENSGTLGSSSDTAYSLSRVNGALLGHYDKEKGVLLLLKDAFKDYCSRIGGSSSKVIHDLALRKIVLERNCRRTLGAGTSLATGQKYCFLIDMKHPEIAGVAPTLVVPPVPANDTQSVAN